MWAVLSSVILSLAQISRNGYSLTLPKAIVKSTSLQQGTTSPLDAIFGVLHKAPQGIRKGSIWHRGTSLYAREERVKRCYHSNLKFDNLPYVAVGIGDYTQADSSSHSSSSSSGKVQGIYDYDMAPRHQSLCQRRKGKEVLPQQLEI